MKRYYLGSKVKIHDGGCFLEGTLTRINSEEESFEIDGNPYFSRQFRGLK